MDIPMKSIGRKHQGVKTQEARETPRLGRLLVDVTNISYRIGNRPLFAGLSFSVREGESVALVGASGTGKSILVRMIVGRERPDTGQITVPSKVAIGYVPQEPEALESQVDTTNIKRSFLQARGLDTLEFRIRSLEALMAHDTRTAILDEYSRALHKYEEMGGYAAESKMEEVLDGMGLSNRSIESSTEKMSSGQRVRLMIAQALFVEPDLLVLDDPASHLDAQARGWLSSYLARTSKGCLVVSSDHDFINGFANKVVEITPNGRAIAFRGNYHDFIPKRDQMLEAERREAAKVQAKVDQLEVTLSQQKVWGDINTAASVHVRRTARRIERLENQQDDMPATDSIANRRVRARVFEEEYRSGEDVVTVNHVQKRYGEAIGLDLSTTSFLIRRGDVFAILGANGSGKSTLLRMIARAGEADFTPDQGEIILGSRVRVSYYAPDWNTLDESRTLFQELKATTNAITDGRARAMLDYWGFDARSSESVRVSSLSKGERVQLSLAKLMLNNGNVLILDEPTMNLTPPLKWRLIESLHDFAGTIILATHDTEFSAAVAVTRSLKLPQGILSER